MNEENIKVNNITMKKVDENFSNAQKVIITNDNKIINKEKKEIEKKIQKRVLKKFKKLNQIIQKILKNQKN